MGTAYARYMNNLKDKFGDGLMLYADVGPISQYGSWGIQEYVGQPASLAPKLQAVANFAATLQ
jgi:hypothetical protein